jgi:aminoglycoside N3'-acetyltransferase
MFRNKIDESIFLEALKSLIKTEDKVIVLYSGIWTFANNLNFKNTNIAKVMLEILEKFVSSNRTLILPSFSDQFVIQHNYFKINSSIDNIGIIPKEALKSNKYYRTPQPLHSYLVLGKDVTKIKKLKLKTSWGKTSIFNYISKSNARICNLGLNWNRGCSYLHRYEELTNVPWRYFKKFEFKMYRDRKFLGICKEVKFCSPEKGLLKYDYKKFIPLIEKRKSFLKFNSNLFKFESVKAKCLDNISKIFFKNRPFDIVINKKEVRNWIKYKKTTEIKKIINLVKN